MGAYFPAAFFILLGWAFWSFPKIVAAFAAAGCIGFGLAYGLIVWRLRGAARRTPSFRNVTLVMSRRGDVWTHGGGASGPQS
ncbi:MAG: hypothetical protein IT285_03075 [Bdellovibrionales bacterium]|nr:hypothetical protein [Bdellovibrionales bacterium]